MDDDEVTPRSWSRVAHRLVALGERDHDGHVGAPRVRERLLGLRHHAVVRGHHQHHQVRDPRSARAHGGEGCVAGRVQEGERRVHLRQMHHEGADVLRDAARLALRHRRCKGKGGAKGGVRRG
eukprot:1036128-Prorocentrum_minimum.AAC.1